MKDYENTAWPPTPPLQARMQPTPPIQMPAPAPPFSEPGYEALADALHAAYVQAARGKGHERHADDKPFLDQPIFHIAERRGLGFLLGQADKKSEEGQGMAHRGDRASAQVELLGAIVYLAAAYLHLDKGGRL